MSEHLLFLQAAGSGFHEAHDLVAAVTEAVGAPPVIVISYGLWEREFARDPHIAGRVVTLDGSAATIVGVLPADFQFARMGTAEIWAPINRAAQLRSNTHPTT